MFERLFNHESPFWQAIGRLGDLVWLNILFLLASVPIVTAGASFTALYDSAWRLHDEQGGPTGRIFWTSFRRNFRQATLIWLVVLPLVTGVVVSWTMFPMNDLFAFKVVLTLMLLLVFPYFFFLPARFENTTGALLRNAILIPLSRLPYAFGVFLLTLVLAAITVATYIYIPVFIPVLALGGFGLISYASIPLLNQSVEPWVRV